ncbi:hypothetical protein [Polynucleobacter sp. UK-Kesae-W10]|uniref:hypothetical protein n=1 Tax=Polynucleobacter sp. UK-Kesae-W10 TaxID=1819738 RepID=UPI001C0DF917|nr:hypothetical protein [Polynucleobacter sp. UK-Kesae-W10]MBU3577549.1 hypothetical protein [Polynucleobacter sp. UK-Kesae-W10]
MSEALLIAIDYDNTYSSSPRLWERFAATAREEGHEIVICTGRAFAPELDTSITIHCTGGQAKADYLASLGIRPNIWVDDDPVSITQNDITF